MIRSLLFMISFYHVRWHNDYIKHTATSFAAFFPTFPLFRWLNKSVWMFEKRKFISYGSRSIVSSRNFPPTPFFSSAHGKRNKLSKQHSSLKTIGEQRSTMKHWQSSVSLLGRVQNTRRLVSFVSQIHNRIELWISWKKSDDEAYLL